MTVWYQIIDFLLPFEWTAHLFMKNALLGVLLITPLFGLLGTMVVSNRMAFFSDALGHGAYTGIALGALMGLIQPTWAAVVFSVIFAVAVTLIKNKSRSAPDTIIGVFSSIAIALGLVLMSVGGGFGKYSAYLIGDLLSISPGEIGILLVVFALLTALWWLIFNPLLLVSVNPSLAASRGVKPLPVELLFTTAVAVVVTISIQWVGLLIINSLLVLPAASARNITRNARQYTLVSVIISLFSGISGLIASYYFNTATGATVVLVSGLVFFISLALKNRLR